VSIKFVFFYIFIHFILAPPVHSQQATISGYIRQYGSQENIPGASIVIDGINSGTTTNLYGFYSIKVPANRVVKLVASAVGYKKQEQIINTNIDKTLTILLEEYIELLGEVNVSHQSQSVSSSTIGLIKLPIQQLKQVPALLGEKDIIKALQLLPGVQKGTEGSTALYVRGGGADQNLILLDEAPVYNANHLFGFFSTFNGDAIKSVEFWKGGFPARYGGRLSSVIDLTMKDGGKDRIRGDGGIGLLSTRLSLDGPINQKSSFLLSGRRSYLDLLTKPFMPKNEKMGYRFYDFNGKVTFQLSKKDNLYLSFYTGGDQLAISEVVQRSQSRIISYTQLGWGNSTATARWNHQMGSKLFLNSTFLFTDFRFSLSDDFKRESTSNTASTFTEYRSSLQDFSAKFDLDYFYSNFNTFRFGGLFTQHQFKPRVHVFQNREEDTTSRNYQLYNTQEFAFYAEDSYTFKSLSANVGVRLNGLQTGDRLYFFPEPRVSLGLKLHSDWNAKASYAHNNQFLHLLSNTGTGLATDLWVPVTNNAPPPQADQISFGVARAFPATGLEFSIESYRKWMRNILTYKEGVSFLSIGDDIQPASWEDNVTSGRGWSYGTELLLQKKSGKLSGWAGYTLSWTIHQFGELNRGQRFFPKYDRRHDASIVLSYKYSPKITFGATWVYGTGQALSVPTGYYFSSGSLDSKFQIPIDYLGTRNSFRADAYHRLDVSAQFHKRKKWGERYWEIGIYNAYNRRNPLYYYVKDEYSPQGRIATLEKKSLFPVIPSISYNFRF
jgi:hypothetical protein